MGKVTKRQIEEVCNLLLRSNNLSVDDIVESFKRIGFHSDLNDRKWDGSSCSIFGFISNPRCSRFWIHFHENLKDSSGITIEQLHVDLVYNKNYEISFRIGFDTDHKSMWFLRDGKPISINECILDKNLKYFHKFILKFINTVYYGNVLLGNEPIEYLAKLK